jgi:phage internal scaffolding protein
MAFQTPYKRNKYEGINFPSSEKRTKSEHQKDCNINEILKKYNVTGVMRVNPEKAKYEDFSKPFDYQEAQNIIIEAEERFQALPADVRKKFDNDPLKMLETIDNATDEELADLGFIEKKASDSAASGGLVPEPPVDVSNPETE